MSSFDPDALECLAAILEEGGFERAAQRLAITQSAVRAKTSAFRLPSTPTALPAGRCRR